jgi:hypothetical protein
VFLPLAGSSVCMRLAPFGVMLRLMVMRKVFLAALLLAVAGCAPRLTGSVGLVKSVPVGGPSARQLAGGRWTRIPLAPIRLCDALALWDGRDLIVVEHGYPPCRPAAAAYDPRANSWRALAAPPGFIGRGQGPVAAWGGGRLLLVMPMTGAAVTWSAATGRWQRTAPVPAAGAVSVSWTGSRFLVITLTKITANRGTAGTFALSDGRWARLPSLPQPARGQIVEAATATGNGSVYALTDVSVWHTNPSDTYDSGSVELLRLTDAGWTRVPLSRGAPRSQLTLTQVGGAFVAAGSQCPGIGLCMGGEDGAVALLRPGADAAATTALRPQHGVPYPRNIAAGGHAIVVTYAEGLGRPIPPEDGPLPGSCAIYDITTRTWLKGPTSPEPRAGPGLDWSAYWTPYGVVNLAQALPDSGTLVHIGGWLLRPAIRRFGD